MRIIHPARTTIRARRLAAGAVLAASAAAAPTSALAQDAAVAPRSSAAHRTGHVEANGVRYYYEIHGAREPLLLLHGGLGNIDMFGPLLPALARNRTVIGVDLHGHGRTRLGDRPIDLADIGNDLAVVLRELGYGRVDVLGYSFGAGAGFRLAVQHPQTVRRLVLVSGAYARDGFHPEILAMQAQVNAGAAQAMRETPMYQSYAAVAPDPAEFPRLLDAMGALMQRPYDWSDDVARLTMPVMLVYGDSDMFRPEHVVRFYQLLGGGLRDAGWMREHMSPNRLAILPGVTHYDIFFSPRLLERWSPSWTARATPAPGPSRWRSSGSGRAV